MITFLYAAVCACLLAQVSRDIALKDLYNNASEAIAQTDYHRAIPQLREIVDNHSDSSVAAVVSFHLAECLQLDGNSIGALDVLQAWAPKVFQSSATGSDVATGTQNLVLEVSHALPKSIGSAERIEAIAFEMRDVNPRLAEELWTQAHARWLELLELSRAAACRKVAIEHAEKSRSSELEQKLNFHNPMHAALSRMADKPRAALELLDQIELIGLDLEQVTAVRFARSEASLHLGDLNQALAELSKIDVSIANSEDAEWQETVALRIAEISLRRRQYNQVREKATLVLSTSLGATTRNECRVLLARVEVAEVQFDRALALLRSVAEDSPTEELLARSTWMQGEIYFLQRQYLSALEQYTLASQHDGERWRWIATLQAAKCQELLGRSSAALALYQQVAGQNERSELSEMAKMRLASIHLAPTSIESLPAETTTPLVR